MIGYFKRKIKEKQKRCYEENKNAKGICYGVYGGDSYTDHLSYACIGCPYHTPYFRRQKMGIKRLTYDAKGKHFCDYSTREIINQLAECEIMLERIEQIVANNENDGMIGRFVREVIEDGTNK